jgi:hypothetical protein
MVPASFNWPLLQMASCSGRSHITQFIGIIDQITTGRGTFFVDHGEPEKP